MKPALHFLAPLITVALCAALLAHGPIAQLDHYHDFADQSVLLTIPHAADVLSNIAFALVAGWGLLRLWPARRHAALAAGWHGYLLFLVGLALTALGSSFYHLAPDNARLVFDRLPIALACAGLIAAVRAESLAYDSSRRDAIALALIGVASVAWWAWTDRAGAGDLRPYLLLQGLPLILIPLWQGVYKAPKADRIAFGAALLLYVLAKAAEVNDHALLAQLGVVSGHTLKHLLAAAAAGLIVARLVRRTVVQPASRLHAAPAVAS
ncbi:MAG: hypothetical protein ABIT83_04535 [Massilia sp.]